MASAEASSASALLIEMDDTGMRKQRHAYLSAYEQLSRIIEPFGPLDRQAGVNMYQGVDIVNHKSKTHALTPIGVLLVAVERLRLWEARLQEPDQGNVVSK